MVLNLQEFRRHLSDAENPSPSPPSKPVMPNPLYLASVPVFLRYLGQIDGLLDATQQHVHNAGVPAVKLLEARLAPDMYPLQTQFVIAANFALRTCFPLAGLEVPAYGEHPFGLEGLKAGVQQVRARIEGLDPTLFDAAGQRVIQGVAGQAVLRLSAPEFLHQFALPNFFFHHVSIGHIYQKLDQLPISFPRRQY